MRQNRLFIKLFQVSFILAFCIFLAACSTFSGKNSEGVIKYGVTYPNLKNGGLMKDMMPKEMTYTFNDDKYITELSAGMGLFKTQYLLNTDKKTFAHLLKLLNIKSVLKLDKNQVDSVLKTGQHFKFIPKGDTKQIAGYKCQHMLAENIKNPKDTFSIYYTKAIKMENPNWGTPFEQIPGVMLEYDMTQKGMTMHFLAKEITFKEVGDDTFQIPSDYKSITPQEMNKRMDAVFSDFN